MAELGQQTVEFSTVVSRTAEESFLSLKDLIDKSKSTLVSDSDKKINLLKFIVNTQQRFLRLNVLAKWCKQVPLIQYSQQLASTLSSHDKCFTETADSLFYTQRSLQQARAPIYDVPSAIEIFLTGSYQRLPKCIEDVGPPSVLNEDQQKPALRKLDVLVRSKLLETPLPREISEVKVSHGTAQLCVEGEFKVLVTLGYRGYPHLWRILHLEILVGERNEPVQLKESQRFTLGDDLERRMACDEQREDPFRVLYLVLHEFCIALVMDTVIKQVRALCVGRWKDAIKFELIYEDGEYEGLGHPTPGVKILYWLDLDKNDGSTGDRCPYIKIEPGSKIKCVHNTFVVDPCTGKEADLFFDLSCIDVEKLLLEAIRCNRYTRLLEIKKELVKNGEMFRGDTDVLLKCNVDDEAIRQKKDVGFLGKQSDVQEVLCVRAYGSFFILGINIRNGRYQLQSSRNVIAPLALSESEEALNQGTLSATEVFINLRSKSILHLFALIGMFLGLEVFENGLPSVEVPKTITGDSSYLLMGFPNCGSSYFLLLQPRRDFKITFKLLEMHPDVVRFKNIDVTRMHLLDDAMNSSILDLENVSSFLPITESGLISDSTHEEGSSMTVTVCPPSSFSSIVDEVFELEKGIFFTSGRNISSSLASNSQSSQKRDGNVQMSHISSSVVLPTQCNESKYLRSDFKGLSRSHVMASKNLSDCPTSGATGVSSCSTTPSSSLDADLDTPLENDKTQRKRKFSKMVNLLLSLRGHQHVSKRRRLTTQPSTHIPTSFNTTLASEPYTVGGLIAEANKGNAVPNIYISSLLHVVRHCSLCIKHAALTTQLDALDIPYVEEVGLRNTYSHIWFRLPNASGHSWPHICLRLGRPGNLCWDVKITDEHFRDLWELQKGSSNTPWGSGVRVANTSDVDSHIHCDSEGVVLSYKSVEKDSVEKVVRDVCRLSSARMFALGMRELLGVKADEKVEENADDDGKTLMRRAFRIEAVGLMSVWFSFGLGVLARFVVEWESGKERCTMHVSPDQLWPHTKFLEDFINGGEVSSLLDCIRLTAAPLHALAAAIRPARIGQGGIVPSSLLPIDVSVVLRGPYWIRIIFRKHFAVDMRCFAGDQVWLQPATPPFGGPSVGGSLPCPQFRPFIMEHVAQELNGLDPNCLGVNRVANSVVTGSNVGLRRSPGGGVPSHVRGEVNTAIIGLGDDGGYGGGWVPLVALKKVLRGVLKYLGVLWLFSQLPHLLKEILGSILKENEGALLNLDQEQPALRFFVGGYVFAVSVHRVQLLLQVLSVKRFNPQQQQNSTTSQEELTQSEISEICDYFSRRVASEPYDTSRVASFITLLTLPISVLREFLKLISWKKVMSQTQGGTDVAPSQKPRIELCLENHGGSNPDGTSGAKSNIHYDRAHNSVDFGLTVVLDPAHVPHINAAGGAAWLPYCVSVRLRYLFGENTGVSFIGMDGSHGGRACWFRADDWEKCKQRVGRSIEVHGTSPVDISQGRLKLVADNVQRTLHLCLQGLRDGISGAM